MVIVIISACSGRLIFLDPSLVLVLEAGECMCVMFRKEIGKAQIKCSQWGCVPVTSNRGSLPTAGCLHSMSFSTFRKKLLLVPFFPCQSQNLFFS